MYELDSLVISSKIVKYQRIYDEFET